MFEKCVKVEPFMCDRNNKLPIKNITHLLSDIMERNANSYGASADYHHAQNMVWVLVEYEIEIKALPTVDQTINVGTLPYSFKRMFGYRIYHITDEEGNVLVKGKGKFVLVNYKTKELIEPSDALLSLFTDAIKEPTALKFTKHKYLRNTLLYQKEAEVLDHFIDINNHMNNAYYVALAEDYLLKEYKETPLGFKVYYKKETFVGQKLFLKYYQEKQGILVDIYHQETLCSSVFIQTKKE